MRVRLFLRKASIYKFVNWFSLYMRDVHDRHKPEQHSQRKSRRVEEALSDVVSSVEQGYPTSYHLDASGMTDHQILFVNSPKAGEEDIEWFRVEVFSLHDPTTPGMELLTESFVEELEDEFLELLRAIAVRWPEAKVQLREQGVHLNGDIDEDQAVSSRPMSTTSTTAHEPQKPDELDVKAGLDVWFEYYYEMQRKGFRYTTKDIAEKVGFSHGYVRQKKSLYDAEHGKENLTKSDKKS